MRLNWQALVIVLLGFLLILPATAEAAKVHGVLRVVKGKVEIKSGKNGRTKKARIGQKVYPKDTIITGKGARVKVVMIDKNEINISPGSQVVIANYQIDTATTKKKVLLDVIYGKVRNKVKQKYDGKQSSFKVKTPTAVAGVRGTDFFTSFSASSGKTQIVTFEGKVAFGKPGPGGSIKGAVMVKVGETSSAGSGNSRPEAPRKVPKNQLAKLDQSSDAEKAAPSNDTERQPSNEKSDKKDDKAGEKEGEGPGGESETKEGGPEGEGEPKEGGPEGDKAGKEGEGPGGEGEKTAGREGENEPGGGPEGEAGPGDKSAGRPGGPEGKSRPGGPDGDMAGGPGMENSGGPDGGPEGMKGPGGPDGDMAGGPGMENSGGPNGDMAGPGMKGPGGDMGRGPTSGPSMNGGMDPGPGGMGPPGGGMGAGFGGNVMGPAMEDLPSGGGFEPPVIIGGNDAFLPPLPPLIYAPPPMIDVNEICGDACRDAVTSGSARLIINITNGGSAD